MLDEQIRSFFPFHQSLFGPRLACKFRMRELAEPANRLVCNGVKPIR